MQTQNPFWVVGDAEGKIASSLVGLFVSPRSTGTPNRAIERAKGTGTQSVDNGFGR
jgi:hypothetical protein